MQAWLQFRLKIGLSAARTTHEASCSLESDSIGALQKVMSLLLVETEKHNETKRAEAETGKKSLAML